jgi:hypothetical protein
VAAAHKGKALLYTCTIVSTVVTILIVLNIIGVISIPGAGGNKLPLGSSAKFDLTYFLTFTVFPVLILFNLVFWVFTAVSGRMFANRPGVRQTMQLLYALVTIGLLAILALRLI